MTVEAADAAINAIVASQPQHRTLRIAVTFLNEKERELDSFLTLHSDRVLADWTVDPDSLQAARFDAVLKEWDGIAVVRQVKNGKDWQTLAYYPPAKGTL